MALCESAHNAKNWLFVGAEDTGGRSAILYTIIESAKRHGHDPHSYLKDVLERLPSTRTTELEALLPANWRPREAGPIPLLATA